MNAKRLVRDEEQLDLFADLLKPVVEQQQHKLPPLELCGECFIATGNPFGCVSHSAFKSEK